jgi:hypothetical protein
MEAFVTALAAGFNISTIMARVLVIVPLLIVGILVGMGLTGFRYAVDKVARAAEDRDQNAREKGFRDYDDYRRNV